MAACCLPAAEPGPGFLNVEHAEGPGRLLSAGYRETNYDEDGEAYTHVDGIFAGNIGRTTVIDVHRGWLVMAAEAPGALKPGRYSTIDHRLYDISDPGNPILVEAKGGQAGYHTHGSRKSGNIWRSGTGWTIDDAGNLSGEAIRRWPKAGHDSSWTGWSRSFEWSYGIPKDPYWIARWDDAERDWVTYGTDPAKPWNVIADTGVIGFGFIVGNILVKVADQSQTGVATYDISDPANPVLLDVIQTEHGIGSYWPSIWKHWALTERDGVLTAIDFGDPTDLRVTEIPFNDSAVGGPGEGTSHHATYGQLQDHFYFVDRFKVDLRPLESGGEPVIVQALPRTASLGPAPGSNTAAGIGTSQWALPVGNTWISGGYAAAQGAAIWLHDPDPSTPTVCEADTVGPTVGYHIPQDGQEQCSTITPIVLLIHETIETSRLIYGETVFLRVADDSDPVAGDERVDCLDILFSMDDFLTIAPKEHLDPDTSYEVIVTTDALTDAVGNPLQDQTGPGDTLVVDGVTREIAYRFSFTTADGSNRLPQLADPSFSPTAPVALDQADEAPVTLRFSASDPDGDPLDYLVDYGDGGPATPSESNDGAWTAVPVDGQVELTHTYRRAGNFRLLIRVRERAAAERGTYRLASRSLTVPVITAPPPSLPRQTSTVAIDEAGGLAWAVNPDNDTVARLDLSAPGSYHLIEEVAVGRHPAGVAIDSQGHAWVACRDDDTIHVIDRAGTVRASFDPANSALRYGDRPVAVLFAQDGAEGYAVLEGGSTLLLLDGGGDAPAVAGRAPERHGLNVEIYDFKEDVITVDDLNPTNPFPRRTSHNFRLSTGTWSGGLDSGAAQELLEDNIRMDEEHHLFFRKRSDGSIGLAHKFGLVYRGWLEVAPGEVPADGGPVDFSIESSGAVRLTIDGQVVAENVSDRSDKRDPLLAASGSIVLTPGRHAIELRQVEQTPTKVLTVQYEAAGIARQTVPASRLFPREEQRQLGAAALNWDGSRLLVAQRISDDHGGRVAQFDTASGSWREQPWFLFLDWHTPPTPTATAGLPNYVAGLAFGFDTERAWYVAEKTATHFGLARGQGPKDVDHPTFETSVRFLAGQIDLQAEHHVYAEPWAGSDPAWRVDIDNFGQPSAIAVSPFGNQLVVAEQGMNRVLVLDAVSGRELDRAGVGLAPQGLAIRQRADGRMEIWTQNLTDRSVSVIDATGTLLQGRRGLASAANQQIATITDERRMSRTEVRGKQLFYAAAEIDADKQPAEIQDPTRMSQDGYLSCATCHLDGGHDGRTWDFSHRGEGLRNTISLRGKAGMSQGNVHWSANFDEIQDFENDIRNHFGGAGFLHDRDWRAASGTLAAAKSGRSADLDALATYVASLGPATVPRSPHRAADGSLTAAAIAGRQHFASLDCASCHDPARGFTDSQRGTALLHDVGTLKESSGARLGGGAGSLSGIDTPTLLGLHASAPYLHDGTAGTLAAVFEQHLPSGDHDISSLNASEQEELIAYLLQIDGRDDDGVLPAGGDGRLAFASARISSGEHRSAVVLTVERHGPLDSAVTVDYRTVIPASPAAAEADEDFRPVSGTLSWAAGEAEARSITIELLDDVAVDEDGDEIFNVLLDRPIGGLLGEPSLARVTLLENDVLQPDVQPVAAQQSARDEDLDGAGDSLTGRLIAGNSGGSNAALLAFTLDETWEDPALWGVDLVGYSTISQSSDSWPNADAHLLRVGEATPLSPADYQAAPIGLVAEDLLQTPIADGQRIALSLDQQVAFLQLLRDQGAATGDEVVLRLSPDGPFAKGWMRYELASEGRGEYPPPALQLVTRRAMANPGRSITIDLIDRRDHDARIDDGLPRPVPADFQDLLKEERHRLRFEASDRPDGDG